MKTTLTLTPLLCLLAISASAAEAQKPNVVVILSDDYGYGSSNCYGADPKLIQTPNIDRIAREGRRFTDANTTSSVCSPTRYSVLTGRYCWRTSLKHEVLGTTSPLHIRPGRLNLASLLKKYGYSTAAIGKWHLGYGTDEKVDFTKPLKPGPLEIGFDYHFGVPANHGDIAGVYVENHRVYGLRSDKIDPDAVGKNFKDRPFIGLDAPHRVDDEVMPFLTTKTVEWIEKQSKDQPFFLYYTPVAIHNPVTPSKQTAGTSKAGPYGDWIHELDASVGGVLDALDRKGFTENTLILFTSDNGGVCKPFQKGESTDAFNAGLKISGPYRGGKHDVWEGGFHVPYIVRWPGHVPAGTVCDETLSLVDTLATIAAVVGEPLPPCDVGAEDSFNMLSAWLGKKHEAIRPDVIVHSADGVFAIRKGPWKWIEGDYHPETRFGALKTRGDQFKRQLFNLEDDLAETTDVTQSHPYVVEELEVLLNRYRDGKYSRELPPPSPPRKKPKPLDPIEGKVIHKDDFASMPDKPWAVVRGRWNTKDGVLYGNQKGGERAPGAMRLSLNLQDGDLQYQLNSPLTARHVLRVQGEQRDYVFLVTISPQQLAISRQAQENEAPGNKLLAEMRLKLTPDEWADVRIRFQGDELAAQVGTAVVRAKHESFAGKKTAAALMVYGQGISFRNLVVYQANATEK